MTGAGRRSVLRRAGAPPEAGRAVSAPAVAPGARPARRRGRAARPLVAVRARRRPAGPASPRVEHRRSATTRSAVPTCCARSSGGGDRRAASSSSGAAAAARAHRAAGRRRARRWPARSSRPSPRNPLGQPRHPRRHLGRRAAAVALIVLRRTSGSPACRPARRARPAALVAALLHLRAGLAARASTATGSCWSASASPRVADAVIYCAADRGDVTEAPQAHGVAHRLPQRPRLGARRARWPSRWSCCVPLALLRQPRARRAAASATTPRRGLGVRVDARARARCSLVGGRAASPSPPPPPARSRSSRCRAADRPCGWPAGPAAAVRLGGLVGAVLVRRGRPRRRARLLARSSCPVGIVTAVARRART